MKKILYISYDGLTDPLGQSQVLPYLTELAKRGYEYTIISFEKKDRFLKEGEIVEALTGAAHIKWVPLPFTSRPPVLSKIYDRWKLKKTARQLQQKENFDLIHCRSYVAAEIGLMLKKEFGTKFLFDMRGFWADEKVDNGQWDQRKLLYKRIYKFYKKKEAEFLLGADGIITLTHASREYLLGIPAYQRLFIEVIPCCADLDHFDFRKIDNAQVTGLRNDLGIPAGARIITYLGSVGGWYMTREMFAFFKTLERNMPNYVMLILTKDDAGKVRSEAVAAGIPGDRIFVTYSNRQQLPIYLAMGDCSIFFIRKTFSKIASSPTKHGELMGMGVPVICNDIGDTGFIVNSTRTGLVVENYTEENFQQQVEKVNELKSIDKEYIRESAKKIFDLQMGVEKYLHEYERILH